MQKTVVTVRWTPGLHMLPAARLVQLAHKFRSVIRLRVGSKLAEATSILSVLILCAVLNTSIEIEANGSDEREAVEAMQVFFDSGPDQPR